MCCVCARIPRGGAGRGGRQGGCPGARRSPAEGGSGSGAGGAAAAAMVRRRKAKAAATGLRRAPAALPSPASSSEEDEAPEEVPFGVAKEAAAAERKLVGEAARRCGPGGASCSRTAAHTPALPSSSPLRLAPLISPFTLLTAPLTPRLHL